MNTVRTVSDTKRAFYNIHTRPVSSIYRRVVEELMVEMHLLAVNGDFRYDPIFALGVVTTFDRFMQGYRPDPDKESIFQALCKSLEQSPEQYRHDAEQLNAIATQSSWETLFFVPKGDLLESTLNAIAANPRFKYSRLFAVGLFTLIETADPEVVKDEAKYIDVFKQIAQKLNLQADKIQKDLDLYRSNLDKMAQAQAVLADALAADRKKREERAQAKPTPDAAEPSTDQAASGS